MPAAEAHVAAEAPGLDLVAAALEEELEGDERHLVRHESRQEQHGVAVAAARAREDREAPGKRGHLEERARLHELVDEAGLADVSMSLGHGFRSRPPARGGRLAPL
jgi:hypothetical protein